MALAGAERIFELIDEEAEQDTGYVTLTHVKNKNNEVIETTDKDGVWAWKHPHHDGTLTCLLYTSKSHHSPFLLIRGMH